MRAEQRAPTLQRRVTANQQWEEPVPEAKPYDIPKRLVWEAYQRVRANRGAAGVDGVSLAAFEKDLKGNLYKVRSALDAVATARKRCWDNDWVIDLDIKAFFDSIPHDLV